MANCYGVENSAVTFVLLKKKKNNDYGRGRSSLYFYGMYDLQSGTWQTLNTK